MNPGGVLGFDRFVSARRPRRRRTAAQIATDKAERVRRDERTC